MTMERYTTQIAIELINEQELAKLQALLLQADSAQRKFAAGASGINKGAANFKSSATVMTSSGNTIVGTFDRMADGSSKFGYKVTETAGDVANGGKKMMVSWQAVRRVITGVVIARALGKVTQALNEALRASGEFKMSIEEIRSLQGDYIKSSVAWSAALKRVSDDSSINILSVAEGAYQALSNQVASAADAHIFLAETADLANVAVANMETSVSAVSAIMNSYGMNVSDTREISAALFATVEQGRLRLEDLANTIGNVTIVASQLGISYQEVLASIASLTRKGTSAANAQTYLRNAMLAMIKPSKAMTAALTKMGYASGRAAIDGEGLIGLFDKLYKVAGLSGDELAELAKLFPRIRGLIGAAGLGGDLEGTLEIFESINDSMDNFNDKVAQMEGSSIFKLRKELNEVRNSLIGVGEKLVDFTGNIPHLAEIINTLGVGAIIALGIALVGMVPKLAIATGAVKGFTMVYALMVKVITFGITVTATAAAALVALGVATLGATYWVTTKVIEAFGTASMAVEADWDRMGEKAQEVADRQKKAWDASLRYIEENTEKTFDSMVSIMASASSTIKEKMDEAEGGLKDLWKAHDAYLGLVSKPAEKLVFLQKQMKESIYSAVTAKGEGQHKLAMELFKRTEKYMKQINDMGDVWGIDPRMTKPGQAQEAGWMNAATVSNTKAFKEQLLFHYDDYKNRVGSISENSIAIMAAHQMGADFQEANLAFQQMRIDKVNLIAGLDKLEGEIAVGAGHMKSTWDELGKTLSTQTEGMANNVHGMGTVMGATWKKLKGIVSSDVLEEWAKQDQVYAETEGAAQALLHTVGEMNVAMEAFEGDGIIKPEEAAKMSELAVQLGRDIQVMKDAGIQVPAGVDAFMSKLQGHASQVSRASGELVVQTKSLDTLVGDMKKKIDPISQMTVDLQKGADLSVTFATNWKGAMKEVGDSSKTLSTIINTMAQHVANIRADMDAMNDKKRPERDATGGLMHYATGGFARRFASGGSAWGVGQDRILGSFAKSEFVMNSAASAQFYPQLVAMNSGGQVPNQSPGNVSVGDINVTLQGGDTTEQSVRDIAHELDRAIQRRVVRFGR